MFSKISEQWQKFTDSPEDYKTTDSYDSQSAFEDEYAYAQRLKEELLLRFKDIKFENVIKGEVLRNEFGNYLCISSSFTFTVDTNFFKTSSQNLLLENLKLIYGIGDLTEKRLKNLNYGTIESLLAHPRFSEKAKEILAFIEERNIKELFHLIRNKTAKSHPLVLHLSLLKNLEDFIFLDIETLGLFSCPIILIGIAKILQDEIYFKQYFMRNIAEEKASLWNFVKDLNENLVLVTYNGEAFDVPYIEDRLNYYGLKKSISIPNFDLLLFARKKWGGNLSNCKLVTVEKHILGEERNKDVPSALVPEFYKTYLKTGNIGPLIPIIEHNKEDLLTLVRIYFALCEEL